MAAWPLPCPDLSLPCCNAAAGSWGGVSLGAIIWKLEKEQKELSAKASRLTQAISVLLEEAKDLKVQLMEP
jgi:hypothetical protein